MKTKQHTAFKNFKVLSSNQMFKIKGGEDGVPLPPGKK
jgi:hypothetical protein